MQIIENDEYVAMSFSKMDNTLRKLKEMNNQISKSDIQFILHIREGKFGFIFIGKVTGELDK